MDINIISISFIMILIFSYLFKKLFFIKPNKVEKIFPKNGDHIKLTWLPNPINNPDVKSCYIGCSGIVEDMCENGEFVLNMKSGLLIVSREYDYIHI